MPRLSAPPCQGCVGIAPPWPPVLARESLAARRLPGADPSWREPAGGGAWRELPGREPAPARPWRGARLARRELVAGGFRRGARARAVYFTDGKLRAAGHLLATCLTGPLTDDGGRWTTRR